MIKNYRQKLLQSFANGRVKHVHNISNRNSPTHLLSTLTSDRLDTTLGHLDPGTQQRTKVDDQISVSVH